MSVSRVRAYAEHNHIFTIIKQYLGMSIPLLLPQSTDWYQTIPKELRWDCRVILNFIYRRQSYYESGRVPLSRKILRQYVHTGNLTAAFKHLINGGIIGRSRSYLNGYKSKEHWILPGFEAMTIVWCHDQAVCRRFSRKHRGMPLQPHHKAMQGTLKHIRLNLSKAAEIASQHGKSDHWMRIARRVAAILESETATVFIDSFGHRCHTVLTRLPSKLRAALEYDGQPLQGIDIACSQPFIAAGMIHKASRETVSTQEAGSIKMCPFQKQADELLAVCCSGKFYESLMTDSIGRDDVKRNTFREVYFGRGTGFGVVGGRFRKKWDRVVDWLIAFKRKDYKKSAKALQRLESSIMIDTVGKQLVSEGVPFYTVHDAVYTLPEHTQRVQVLIEDSMRAAVGAAPKMTVE
jgi:hypothetical protein